jgi:predicted nuclease of predicted toxin-antitoxin system
MKILFDQNISFRIINKIKHLYPEAKQVRELGLENSTDMGIWNFANQNGFTIITFDSDFIDISNIKGHPPKIIWLKTGNCTTNNVKEILIDKVEIIKEFLTNIHFKEISCLEIN